MDKQRMFEDNYKLVYSFLNKNKQLAPNLEKDDKEQIASMGLWKAVMGYNSKYGEFSTYAFKCMYNEVCKTFKTNQQRFEQHFGTDAKFISINTAYDSGDGDKETTLEDLIADENNNIEEFTDDDILRCFNDDNWLSDVAGLNKKEIYIMRNMGDKTMTTIAKELDNSKTAIFNLRKSAFSKIKKAYMGE